ncbi:MAG: hypothetical protein IIV45_05210 [Lachnospiraceae bacterium]|nr:hypothetical protein [Lachnospiraceae bacterium]
MIYLKGEIEHEGKTVSDKKRMVKISKRRKDLFNNQMVAVVSNFSKERVELLRNMVKYIYRDKAEKINADSQYQSTTTVTRKQVGIGMTAAGAVATVAGICAHQGLLIAGGVVVAAVGVGLPGID